MDEEPNAAQPMKKVRGIANTLLLGVVGLVAWLCYANRVPRDGYTASEVSAVATRCHLFMIEHHVPPPDLQSLPRRDGHSDTALDGWGRPLIYRLLGDGTIEIGSLGRDGVPGGTGPDADMFQRFRTRNASGKFVGDSELWQEKEELSAR